MEMETTAAEPTSAGGSVPPGVNPAFAEQTETNEDKSAEKAAAAYKKLKIKGREIDVDETKYHEYAQKGAASTETWQEAAKMKKDADAFMQRLKENPKAVLADKNLGIDFRKVAEEYLWEQLQDEQMSPQEKMQRDKERRLEILEAEKAKRDEYETEQQRMAEHQHYIQEFDQKISKALATSGLPKTSGTVRRVAEYMKLDIDAGIDRDPIEYIDAVRADYMADIQELLSSMEGDALLKMLGDESAKKMRTADLKRLKSTTPKEGHVFVPGKGMQKADAPKKLSGKDWERDVMKSLMSR
jgi:hypothetical protein